MSTVKKPSFLFRALRWTASTTLTLGVVAGAGAATVFGANVLADRAEATQTTQPVALTSVAVTALTRESGYDMPRRFLGQVEASNDVPLSFELGGRLTTLLVSEGDLVLPGQIIARLDTALIEADKSRLEANRAAIAAQLEFAQSRLDRATSLRKDGFSSQETLDQARSTRDELRSRIAEIEASLATVRINLEKSVLMAPFAGRVGAQNVDGGETLAAGAPVVSLIQTTTPQVRVGVPLSVTADMLSGGQIEIDGISYDASLVRIRPDIDPVTRTRTAVFAVKTDTPLLFGQTATLTLPTRVETAGTWVPLDALREGTSSVWSVLVVDQGVVRSASVEVLHTSETRAFVRGTFRDGAQLVATGAHRVVPGQRVMPGQSVEPLAGQG